MKNNYPLTVEGINCLVKNGGRGPMVTNFFESESIFRPPLRRLRGIVRERDRWL